MAERNLVVRLIGDASSLVRAFARSGAEAKRFDTRVTISAQASAKAQIAASLKKDARLREEGSAYRAAASAAVRGSREQVVASNLARRADTQLAKSLSVTAAESRAFGRSSATAEREIGRASRGALAGSGVFRGLGRSIAFASGGFLAFASGGQFLRSSIDAAKDAAITQRQLRAQFRASGKDVNSYETQIDKANLKLSALSGFTKDDLDKSFTTIFRTTGNVAKSLRDTATAADIARAKKIGLSAATLIEAKAEGGNLGILRRAGIQVSKNATVEQALAVVRAKFAGQAAAGATQQERFGAVLHDSEVIIGAGLLPTVNRYLASGAAWLTQMSESGRLQRDVSVAAKDFNVIVGDGAAVLRGARTVISGVDRVTGSFENTLKGVAAAMLVIKARAVAINWGLLAAGEASVGSAATAAAGRVGVLEASLKRLKGLGPIAVAVAVTEFFNFEQQQAKHIATQNGPNFTLKGSSRQFSFGGRGGVFGSGVSPLAPAVKGSPVNPFKSNIFGTGSLGLGALVGPKSAAKEFAVAAKAAAHTLSLQGRFNLDELAKARAQVSGNTALQRSILTSEATILKAQAEGAKTLKARTDFYQRLAGVEDEIRSIDQTALEASKNAAKAAKKAADARKKLLQSFTTPLRLQIADVRAQALGLDEKPILAKIKTTAQKALKSGRLGLQGQLDGWNAILGVNDQLKNQLGLNTAKFVKARTPALLAGLSSLDAPDRRALEARLSQLSARGTLPGHGTGAFGFVVPPGQPDIVIHHTTTLDGKQVENVVTRHQQKRRRRSSSQRRGPHAGGGL
jgi:hypothetical protein